MASRIAALQAKLGGGAMIMGGMRPGAARPIRKKKTRQRRASLDNSALLDRIVIKGNKQKKKVALNFDELEDTDEKNTDQFAQSVSSNINMKKTKPISGSKAEHKSNDNPSPPKKKKYGMGMGGMGGLLAKAGGFKRKSKKGNKDKATKDDNNHKHKLGIARDRGQSRSFSKGVTTAPLIPIETTGSTADSDETKRDVPRNVAMMHMVGTNMLNKNSSKTPTINASGYSLAKSAGNEDDKLIEIVSKKHGKRHVRLFVDLQQYVSSKKGESGKGLVIEAFCENKYGAAMQNVGIGIGWKLSKIAKSDATKMSFFIIKNQLKNQAQMSRMKGYTVTFEGEYDKKQPPEPAPTSQTKQPIKEPAEQKMAPAQIVTMLKCELVKEEMGLKVVRLFATFDKYFQGIKGEDGKGLIITGFICDSFKDSGIAIGWKLSKLGKRNVTKSSFVMLRNQLMAQASTAKKFGYELTFIDTAAKRNSSSTPNSPNIANKLNKDTDKNKNVPQTVPLNPVTAPKQKQINTKTESKTEEKEKQKEPQLQTAENPFGGMQQLNIGNTKKKENESGKTKMEHVRNNSLPTSPDKPKFRPKINKTDINKKRPPTQATKKIAAPSPISAKKDDEKSQEDAQKKKDNAPIAKKVKTPIVTAAPKEKIESKEKEKTAKKEKVKTPTPSKKKEKTPPAPQPKQTQIVAKTVITAPPSQAAKEENKTKEKKKIAAKQGGAFKITPKKKHKPLPTAPKKSETETKPKKVKTPTAVPAVKEEIATEQKAKEKEQIVVAPKPGSFNITSKKKLKNEENENKTQTKIKPKPTSSAPKKTSAADVKLEKQSKNNKKSSYSAPKSCELMEEMNAGTKKIKLYQDFEKFFSAQGAKGNKGFAVKRMKRNEFGAALTDLGIDEGWKITECANKALGNRMFAMLKNQISAAARKNRANGYDVIFENPKAQKVENPDEQKVDAQTSQTAKAKPKIGKKANAETGKLKIKKKNSANAAKQKQKAKGTTPKTSKPKTPKPKTPKPKASTPRSSDKPKVKVSKKVAAEKAVKTPTKSKANVTTPKETTTTPKAKREEKKVDPIELHTTTTATIPPLAAAAKISTTPKPKASAYKISAKASTLKPTEDDIEEKKFKKQRKSSYEAPKACYLIQDMTDKKKIKMYQEIRHFFSAEASDGNKGFVIKQMSKNEFGAALSDLGVGEGWKVIECANKVLGNKMFAMIKNQITAASRKNRANGYEVVFEKAKEKAQTAPDLDDKKSQTVPTKARSPRGSNTKKNKSKQRVEVIADGDGVKTLRLYHNMDKYLRSSAEKGRRGFVIAAFVKMFGDDLKECGVDIGWKLVKLGSKDVSKAFYQMTKTNLGVEFRNHKNKGYEVTFAAPE